MDFKPEFKEFSQTANWELCNNILYEMCKKYPYHNNDQEIMAKTLIIGRTYAAAVERGKQENEVLDADKVYKKIVPAFDFLDGRLKNIEGNRIDESNVQTALQIHSELMKRIREESPIKQDKKSFASKYLHFHKPDMFFIYDLIAYSNMNNFIKKKNIYSQRIKLLSEVKDVDLDYKDFVFKCLTLRDTLEIQYEQTITPRQLDNYLFLFNKNQTMKI